MGKMKLLISRLGKLFSMIESPKSKLIFLCLMVFLLSGVELFSLALVGVYLGFVVDSTQVMAKLDSFQPMASTYINEMLPLSSQYIIFGIILVGIFLVKLFFVLYTNVYIFRFSVQQRFLLQAKLVSRYVNQTYESYIQSDAAFSINAAGIFPKKLSDVIVALLKLFADGTLVLFVIIFMISLDFKIFLTLASIFLSFSIGYYILLITKAKRYGEQVNLYNTSMIKSLSNISDGFKEIKIMGKAHFFRDIFINSVRNIAGIDVKQYLISIAPRNILELLVVTFIVLSVAITILFGNNLEETVLTLGFFSICSVRLIPLVSQIILSINTIKYGEDALIHIYRLISNSSQDKNFEASSIDDTHENKFVSSMKKIDFMNVSFAYPNKKNIIINEASFQINSGDFVGVIGPSGSGKTTLVDILLGLLKPQSGKVVVDGIDIFDDLEGWRSKIAYIPQEIFLMNDTIRNNILLGEDPNSVSKTRLDKVILQSNLKEFIDDLPNGLDENVGDNGVSLSGGQRQRVAIARALYHQKEILILDEATSALDTATEEEITGQFEALKGKKTVICIAHRTSTLKSCNKVYSVDNGIITQKNSI